MVKSLGLIDGRWSNREGSNLPIAVLVLLFTANSPGPFPAGVIYDEVLCSSVSVTPGDHALSG